MTEADNSIVAIISYFVKEQELENLSVAHDVVLHIASWLISSWKGHSKAESEHRVWAESCSKHKQHSL